MQILFIGIEMIWKQRTIYTNWHMILYTDMIQTTTLVTLTVPEDSHSIRSSLAGTSVASHGSSETMSLEDNK